MSVHSARLDPTISRELTLNRLHPLTDPEKYKGFLTNYDRQRETVRKNGWEITCPEPEELYACHITAFLPTDGVMRPFSFLRTVTNEAGQPVEISKWLGELNRWKRPTIHWTINQCMQEDSKNQMDPALRCFAIIEPLSALSREALGGIFEDFETLGPHKLSNQAIVLIPQRKAREKEVLALKQSGVRIALYRARSLPEAIHQRLALKNIPVFAPLEEGKTSFFHKITTKPSECVSVLMVMQFFGLPSFEHQTSPMRQMELLISDRFVGQITSGKALSERLAEYSEVAREILLRNTEQVSYWDGYLNRLSKISAYFDLFMSEEFEELPDKVKMAICQDDLWKA